MGVKNLNIPFKKNYGLTVFLAGLLLSVTFILPVMIENGGIFLYYGDFNAQEIPFYQMIHDQVRSGSLVWSSTTDLGAPTVNSYLFYLIGSPFFWMTIPFPSEAVPYLMGPLFMLKFACASFTAYVYLRRYVREPLFAVAGGLLYAFSGFSVYNIFFFHFHEPMIVFPLLLCAVDRFMYDNKRGTLALAVFAACIVNYYFFAGMAVFTAIYWFMLVFTNNYKLTLSKLLLFAFEIILGFAATMFLILPTVLFIMGNPRLSQYPDGYSALVYSPSQRYWYIVLSFFFPSELAAQPNFTPDVNCNWASVSGWLPLVSMTGVIGYMQLKKRDWLKKLVLLLIVMALIPLFNSLFQLLNASIYYARWFYMFVLILSLITIKSLEDSEVDWNRAIRWSACITLGITLLIGLMPNTTEDDNEISTTVIGLAEYRTRFWIYAAIALVSLLAFTLIIKSFRAGDKRLALAVIAGIAVITILSSTYIVQTGNSLDSDEKPFLRENAINKVGTVQLDDIESARSDFYESSENLAMYWQIPSINAFHSVVPSTIMDFYDSIGVTRDVASRPDTDSYGLRGLFSCKYLFDAKYDDDEDDCSFTEEKGKTRMPGWKYYKDLNGCRVFRNEHYIPMGFMYDRFITKKEFYDINKQNRSEAFLKAMVLSYSDTMKYADITGYTEEDIEEIKSDSKGFKSIADDYLYGRYEYFDDCDKLAKKSCDRFEYTSDGFTAEINNTGKDNLVFFSVPYDNGWSAYVNGEEVEIAKANIGFMAVKVPAKTKSTIVFKYEPVGFRTGIIISVGCAIIFFMYLAILFILKRRTEISK